MSSENKTQLNVRISEKVADRLRAVAEVEGHYTGKLVEEAIVRLIDERQQDPAWQSRFDQWADNQRKLLDSFEAEDRDGDDGDRES